MNNTTKYILTVLLGVVSGILSGSLGLGTTTIALPGFLLLNIVGDQKTAIGTTLVSSPLSWGAVYQYYKEGNVDIQLGVLYSFTFVIFAYAGAMINKFLSKSLIDFLICGIYFLLSSYFLYRALKK